MGGAFAQSWPSKTMTMVIPFAAGGPTDVMGRVVGERLSKDLGQQVVIENVGGAGGMTGSARVAKAPPDGYSFVMGTVGTHAMNQSLFDKPAYDPSTDFEPVVLIAQLPLVLLTSTKLPVTDLMSFIAYAKEQGDKLTFGSAGAGSATHLGCVLFNAAIGSKAGHVPYRGTGPAMNDLVAGQIGYLCEIISTAKPQIDAGTVKAIAVFNPTRSAVAANIPTADEQGLKGFEAYTWNAFFMPKGTPPQIVTRLYEATSKALDDPAFKKRLEDLGASVAEPARRTPIYLASFVKSEVEKWAVPIKASGAKVN
jgi:tripartite-type tricarboxylate transporter receptor subunit TctC